MMHVEILPHPPTSGSIEERWFNARGACTWVRFTEADGHEWAGVFGNGDFTQYRAAVLFNEQQSAFIIAGGQGYALDLGTRRLLYLTPHDYQVGIIAVPGRDLVIAADFTDLFAYSSAGPVWRSGRIALDGVHLARATSTELEGHVWQGDAWYEFRLTLDGWRVTQGRAAAEDWLAFDVRPPAA